MDSYLFVHLSLFLVMEKANHPFVIKKHISCFFCSYFFVHGDGFINICSCFFVSGYGKS